MIRQHPFTYACSICSKSHESVERLISTSSGVRLCNECITLCSEFLHSNTPPVSMEVAGDAQPLSELAAARTTIEQLVSENRALRARLHQEPS